MPEGDATAWRPAASLANLRARATLLAQVREFFAQRGVLEVETPVLVSALAPEVHIEPLVVGRGAETRYLLASPEVGMKRLLAAGSGPIYQIGRAFRAGELGSRHNPEFTMLEWYRPGWEDSQLQMEVAELVDAVTGCGPPQVFTFREALVRFAGVDPWESSLAMGRLAWLEWLDQVLVNQVEPGFQSLGGPVILREFPAERAAMARVDPGPPAVARRFEFFLNGMELANGYHELTDSREQAMRLLQANTERVAAGLSALPVDGRFLAALEHGLPPCAGVALGLDRLLMVVVGATEIRQVLAFPFDLS